MQDPPLLRAIYAELRASAGSDVAAGDLLRLAHLVLRAYKVDFIEPAEKTGGREKKGGFHALPVDQAMDDGGWKVLDFETPRLPVSDDLGQEGVMFLHRQLTKFLGHEWRRVILPD